MMDEYAKIKKEIDRRILHRQPVLYWLWARLRRIKPTGGHDETISYQAYEMLSDISKEYVLPQKEKEGDEREDSKGK